MSAPLRDLLPWEARVGCPTCGVRPRQRCKTVKSHYPPGYRFTDGTPALGQPTTAHKARYRLWCYLWCRDSCNNIPSPAV